MRRPISAVPVSHFRLIAPANDDFALAIGNVC